MQPTKVRNPRRGTHEARFRVGENRGTVVKYGMATWRNSSIRYGIIAQLLHWLMAGLILVQLLVGRYAAGLDPGIERLVWMSRHKSLGITILALMLLRLGWRLSSPPPPLPSTMPGWERRTAQLTHLCMYALLIIAPVVGWLSASAYGLSINWFGMLLLPDLVAKNPALADELVALHRVLVYTLAGLLLVHIAAALRHALIRRDGLFSRMLPDFSE